MVIYNQQSATVIRHIFLSMFFLNDCYTSSLPLISLTDRCRPSQCRNCKTLQNNKVYRKCTLCNYFPVSACTKGVLDDQVYRDRLSHISTLGRQLHHLYQRHERCHKLVEDNHPITVNFDWFNYSYNVGDTNCKNFVGNNLRKRWNIQGMALLHGSS